MPFEKLPSIKGSVACLTCGCGAHETLKMDRLLAVGFGQCVVTRNGKEIYSESKAKDDPDEMWYANQAEEAAAKDPDEDWRIEFNAPLYDAEYQRQGAGHWVLISKGLGFA